jgi:hypothetical protein
MHAVTPRKRGMLMVHAGPLRSVQQQRHTTQSTLCILHEVVKMVYLQRNATARTRLTRSCTAPKTEHMTVEHQGQGARAGWSSSGQAS